MKRIPIDSNPDKSIEDAVDWLFSKVLLCSPCAVEAELGEANEPVIWKKQNQKNSIFWECFSRHFRSILARVGNHYLDGQLYEGFGVVDLSLGENLECHTVRIFFGNHSLTGYWIKIFSGAKRQVE